MRRYLLPIPLLLAACAVDQPSDQEARKAMVERMESSPRRDVKVERVHAFSLDGCVRARQGGGVECQVAMDVSFAFDGAMHRSDDRGPMRFAREEGRWKAYPVQSANAD